jgi:hypothetical protein
MLPCLDYNAVYRVFIIGKDPCCPSNAVTFGDSQNDALNILLTIV